MTRRLGRAGLKGTLAGLVAMLLVLLPLPCTAGEDATWYDTDAAGGPRIHLYYFWSATCPHCREASPFVAELARRHPWLVVHDAEVTRDRANAERYVALARSLGQEASSVPAFLFCGRMEVGFGTAESTGRLLEEALTACHRWRRSGGTGFSLGASSGEGAVELPLLGRMEPGALSLPAFTLVIAGLDAFNPCAFFVLLFLLSLLVHANSRGRMLFIGGVFVLFSGLVYFLFMAAWLNVFLFLGELRLVTLGAGVAAVVVALLNVKDYFWFKQGPTLSIPESARPGLYQRVRGLLRAESMTALTVGTVALALVANTYELLCTAGFPMVYTRVLTLSGVSGMGHYLYLALYNLIYVLPLLAIVLVFSFTLGRRKLSEAEGRFLKLVSGLMMLGLGGLLMAAPHLLNDFRAALVLLGLALGLGWTLHRWREAIVKE